MDYRQSNDEVTNLLLVIIISSVAYASRRLSYISIALGPAPAELNRNGAKKTSCLGSPKLPEDETHRRMTVTNGACQGMICWKTERTDDDYSWACSCLRVKLRRQRMKE